MADYDNARVAAIEKKLKKKARNKGATGPGKGQLNDASVSTPGTVDRRGNRSSSRAGSVKPRLIPPASVRRGAEDDAYVNYRSGRTGGNVRAPLSKMVPGDTRSRKGGPG